MLKHKLFDWWYNQIVQQQNKIQPKKIHLGKRLIAIAVVALLLLFVIVLILIAPPERSVASYCKVYKEENAKLPHEGADKYRAAIFTSSANDPGKFAAAFNKLERVSPEDIRHDVKTLKAVFEKMESDPSQSFGASLSGIGAESSVKAWTEGHCKK